MVIPAFDIWENGTIQAAQNLVKDVSIALSDALAIGLQAESSRNRPTSLHGKR